LRSIGEYDNAQPNARPSQNQPQRAFYRRFLMPEESRLLYPHAPAWSGGFRWFKSENVIDLQQYRTAFEKERICRVLLRVSYPQL
jgi:hypothetical protein